MSAMFFAEETWDNFYSDVKELFQKHHEEVDVYGIPLDINEQQYKEMNDVDCLLIHTIRDESNKLLGYSMSIVCYHMHHKTSLQARQDVIYINEELRGKGYLKEFLSYIESELKEFGVSYFLIAVPSHMSWGNSLLKRDYKEVENIYAKEL